MNLRRSTINQDNDKQQRLLSQKKGQFSTAYQLQLRSRTFIKERLNLVYNGYLAESIMKIRG